MRITFCLFLILFFQGISFAASESLLHQFFIGDTKLWVLSLGWQDDRTSSLITHTNEEKTAVAVTYHQGIIRNSRNVLLIQRNGLVVLVDTGNSQNATELWASLLRAGVTAEEVSHVIITHAHPNHINGLFYHGKAAFPNAKILFSRAETDYLLDRANRSSTLAKKSTDIARILKVYQNRVFAFVPDQDIFAEIPGLRALDASGHTRGHIVITLDGGGKTFLFCSDLFHAFDVQSKYPDIASRDDINSAQASIKRRELLNRARSEKWLISGSHMPFVQPREF